MKVSAKHKKVVLAADNRDARQKIRSMLEALGCVVLEVEDSKDAVVTALSEKPFCILLDLDSADNDWIETALTIRGRSELRTIPILMTSIDGRRGIELYQDIDRFGEELIEYIPQPISAEALEFHIGPMRFEKSAGHRCGPE